MRHSVARLREERLARSLKPFHARGSRIERCPGCRLALSRCMCTLRPQVPARSAVCLLMYDTEPLKPSNTGWLIADLVRDNFAFGWSRIEVDPQLLVLLDDPQWQPYVVFPAEYGQGREVVERIEPVPGKRPLFILLDATWSEARKMFRKSPYLERFPVLSITPEEMSRYRLRRSKFEEHLCTAEVAALCLDMAGDVQAAGALDAWLDVFSERYLGFKFSQPLDLASAAHQRLYRYLPAGPQTAQPASGQPVDGNGRSGS